MPKLSVIIPAYNAHSCLERSAMSVLGGEWRDLELIIVDDGSRDETPAICEKLARRDGRVRIIRQENAGVSAARNRGIAESRGEYIAFVDADDAVEPEMYSELFAAMEGREADCAACSYCDEWPDGTRVLRRPPMAAGVYDSERVRAGIVLPLLCDRLSRELLLGTVWRYLFRAGVIKENGIEFSGAYLEDELFLIEYFSHPCRLAVTARELYIYAQNPASVTRRYLPDFVQTFEASAARKQALIEKFDIPAPPWWRLNNAWAGLLIAVSNEFAPGAPVRGRAERVRALCALPLFAEAIASYRPKNMSRNKGMVAFCLRHRLYGSLARLYELKNRGR